MMNSWVFKRNYGLQYVLFPLEALFSGFCFLFFKGSERMQYFLQHTHTHTHTHTLSLDDGNALALAQQGREQTHSRRPWEATWFCEFGTRILTLFTKRCPRQTVFLYLVSSAKMVRSDGKF
jgi:hypothetical protein